MKGTFIILFILLISLIHSNGYYVAIPEHKPSELGDTALENVIANLEMYKYHVLSAKKNGAQMIIFPEFGLNGKNIWINRTTVYPYTEVVEVNTNPCQNPSKYENSPAVLFGSCSAKNNSILMILNMYEKENVNGTWYQYITDAVFDEQGQIIAKYRKSHLFGNEKDCVNPGNESIVTFTSSFGIKFGLFICFDIMFHDPAVELVKLGIKNFPYAYAIPIVGPEVIKTFSFVHGVTMLGSNLDDAESAFHKGSKLSGNKVVSYLANTTETLTTFIYNVPNDN
eukprot:TRINITY_DN7552_c0_g1_i1.p1 TRINITY_DN7552_c0_g1~~TRINITY_DN7552_c0_g1_i1.p1  ORF type:complete len:282 (+),score=64.65 TRINITY_DN7552_c0_g1_i1:2-847(+)